MAEDENETEEVTEELLDCDKEKCPQRIETRLNGLGFPYLFASCSRCGKTKVFERQSDEFKSHAECEDEDDEEDEPE